MMEMINLRKSHIFKHFPFNFRTLKYLMTHLNTIAQHSARTGMTDRNLAIVWAPNLLRSPALEAGGVAALRGVGVQAVVTGEQRMKTTVQFDEFNTYKIFENELKSHSFHSQNT